MMSICSSKAWALCLVLTATLVAAVVGDGVGAACLASHPYYQDMEPGDLAERLLCGYKQDTFPIKTLPKASRQCLPRDTVDKMRVYTSCEDVDSAVLKTAIHDACPQIVRSQIYLNTLWGVDASSQQFVVEAFQSTTWNDPRLSWNATAVGYSNLVWPLRLQEDLWEPDIFIEEATKTQLSRKSTTIDSEGNVMWSQRIIYTLGCNMDFRNFPFDKQHCSITATTFAYDAESLIILPMIDDDDATQFKPIELNERYSSPQFKITVMDPHKEPADITCLGDRPFSITRGELKFHRFASGWMLRAIVPTNAVMVMVILTFFIDPKAAPARVALGIISVLTLFNLENTFSRGLPEIAYSTWLDGYVRAYMTMSILAVMEYGVVHHLVHKAARIKTVKDIANTWNAEIRSPTSSVGSPIAKGEVSTGQEESGMENVVQVPATRLQKWKQAALMGMAPHHAVDYHSRWLWLIVVILINVGMFVSIHSKFLHYSSNPHDSDPLIESD